MTRPLPSLQIGALLLSGEPRPRLQWIEVSSTLQIPGFQLIGLPAPEVGEARERVRAAIVASGLEFPRRRVVLNLSPASVRKRGTGADLAMALAVLLETYGAERAVGGARVVAWGELGLGGAVKAAGACMSALYSAWEAGADLLLVAQDDLPAVRRCLPVLRRGGLIPGAAPPRLAGATTLAEAWACVLECGTPGGERVSSGLLEEEMPEEQAEAVPGPELHSPGPVIERMLGVAASGCHHLILLGPRGTGKTHALEWLQALQPRPSDDVQVLRALIDELSGARTAPGPPVRRVSPHARPEALIGQALPWGVRPGEFSLAHGGLLLADEFPEWSRDSREALREPLERGRVTLTRARQSVELPARFTLAANGNLCPCGGWPPELPIPLSPESGRVAACRCSPSARVRYLSKLSGPILDRLDLVVLIARPIAAGSSAGLTAANAVERLAELRSRVVQTRERSLRSWGETAAQLKSTELERILAGYPAWRSWLDAHPVVSLRSRHKLVRVALTLAAWDGAGLPTAAHFSEAACYRPERYGYFQ